MNYLIIILISFFVICILYFIAVNNKIKKLKNKVSEGSSDIDVALAKRYSVLTKMIEIVKGYAKHEKDTFTEIVKLRNQMTIDEKVIAMDEMNDNVNKINALIEKYPDLKAVETFINLQKSLIDVEEHLQASRRLYNSNVTLYNNLVQSFPSSLIAKITHSSICQYFKANDNEKEIVTIKVN